MKNITYQFLEELVVYIARLSLHKGVLSRFDFKIDIAVLHPVDRQLFDLVDTHLELLYKLF